MNDYKLELTGFNPRLITAVWHCLRRPLDVGVVVWLFNVTQTHYALECTFANGNKRVTCFPVSHIVLSDADIHRSIKQ